MAGDPIQHPQDAANKNASQDPAGVSRPLGDGPGAEFVRNRVRQLFVQHNLTDVGSLESTQELHKAVTKIEQAQKQRGGVGLQHLEEGTQVIQEEEKREKLQHAQAQVQGNIAKLRQNEAKMEQIETQMRLMEKQIQRKKADVQRRQAEDAHHNAEIRRIEEEIRLRQEAIQRNNVQVRRNEAIRRLGGPWMGNLYRWFFPTI